MHRNRSTRAGFTIQVTLFFAFLSTAANCANGQQGTPAGPAKLGPWNETPAPELWEEPTRATPAETQDGIFATPSRGPGTRASYLIYLPPSYASDSNRRFPVLYWLHEGNGNQLNGAPMVALLSDKMRSGNIPPFLVVLVQGLPSVRYFNARDGKRPVEDVIVHDLIPHIDATYRTIASPAARAIEGMSMGGYGALRLGLKFPQLFGVVSALAPSITDIKDEPPVVTQPYGNDQAYYDAVDPRTILRQNAAQLRGHSKIRLLVGGEDGLAHPAAEFSRLMDSLGVDHLFAIAPGAHHAWQEIFADLPSDPTQFWASAFPTTP